MDNKTIVKKYLKKYFWAQYLKETDQEFKALVRILNKKDRQAAPGAAPGPAEEAG